MDKEEPIEEGQEALEMAEEEHRGMQPLLEAMAALRIEEATVPLTEPSTVTLAGAFTVPAAEAASVPVDTVTTPQSVVHYEDDDGVVRECSSLQQAADWLRSGLLHSALRMTVTPPTNVQQQQQAALLVFTLQELMERNGAATPFLFSHATAQQRMDELEAIWRLQKELEFIKTESEAVRASIAVLSERSAATQAELQRIEAKFPVMARRSAQTITPSAQLLLPLAPRLRMTIDSAFPQLRPKSSVDPFAMLRQCDAAADGSTISGAAMKASLAELRAAHAACDRKLLRLRTHEIINKGRRQRCKVCDNEELESPTALIDHMTGREHLRRITAIRRDTLSYWSDAVRAVTSKRAASAAAAAPPPVAAAPAAAGAISPLALLTSCYRPTNPYPSLELAVALMKSKMCDVDGKAFDADPALVALFRRGRVSCCVCARRVDIDKPTNLIAHFTTTSHMIAATKDGGQMHRTVIEYWMAALDRAKAT